MRGEGVGFSVFHRTVKYIQYMMYEWEDISVFLIAKVLQVSDSYIGNAKYPSNHALEQNAFGEDWPEI